MQKAYNVKGTHGENLREEIVVAESADQAGAICLRNGLKPIETTLNANATFSLWTAGDLDPRELAQFYFTLGRRVGSGMEITRAVREAAEFSRNVAVQVTLGNLATSVERGQAIDSAMQEAGLPRRDWSLIRALGSSGRLADALTSLGRDYNRRAILRSKIRGLIYEPAAFLGIIYILAYCGIVFLAPRIQSFFEKLTTIELPPLAQKVYWFADIFNAHLYISTVLYIAAGIGLIFFLRSNVVRRLLDKVPIVRSLSERADHAGLWSVFAMLYDSAARRDEAAALTASTAFREDNRDSFSYMAQRLQRGRELSEAVQEADFPNWVKLAVANAFSSGGSDDVVESLQLFTDNLASDVQMLTERLSFVVTAAVTAIMGLGVAALAFITVVPMVQSALSAA